MFALINIDSKGYGKIYKSVMRDRNLPLLAKTIYAYFASFAGGGTTAFPRRTTIRNARSAAASRLVRRQNGAVDTEGIDLSRLQGDGNGRIVLVLLVGDAGGPGGGIKGIGVEAPAIDEAGIDHGHCKNSNLLFCLKIFISLQVFCCLASCCSLIEQQKFVHAVFPLIMCRF